jgi:hypothetical protein
MTIPESYAWLPPAHHLIEPVRATRCTWTTEHPLWDTVLALHPKTSFVQDLSKIEVVLHHPDLGEVHSLVAHQDLRGNWDEPPMQALVEATGWDPGKTWERIAEERYRWVCEQRDIADRLTALGISRRRRHYASRGGTTVSDTHLQPDASLVLNHVELQTLLDLAERGNT